MGKSLDKKMLCKPNNANYTIYQESDAKRKRLFRRIGVTQIALGCISIVLAVANIAISSTTECSLNSLDCEDIWAFIATGVWCGGMMIFCGSLGLKAAKNLSQCSLVTGLAITLLTAFLSISMIWIEVFGACDVSEKILQGWYVPYDGYPNEQFYLMTVIHSILAAIGFIEMVVATVHSTYCCATVCVGTRQSNQVPNVVYTENLSGSYANAAFQIKVDQSPSGVYFNEKTGLQPPPYEDTDSSGNQMVTISI